MLALFCAFSITLSVSGQVVISQVYGGGGNSGATYKNDFIELFNASGNAVDLSGWSVQYASAAGTSWNVTRLSGSIAPGGYYLVQQAKGAGGTVDLPTPDASGTTAMSATSGKVALVNSQTAISGNGCVEGTSGIIDLVGFGSANCFEGSAPAGQLSNTLAAIRNSNGCQDSGDNSADFTQTAPAPRNSASPRNPCAPIETDTENPYISSRNTDGITEVPVSIKPAITFNEAIEANEGAISVQVDEEAPQLLEIGSASVIISSNVLTLDIVLKPNRKYTITIPAGLVKDAAGNLLEEESNWTFNTGEQQLSFNFNTCSNNSLGGFTQYSVTGEQTWSCGATFGIERSGSVQINGFANGSAQLNEDWLISPSFDLSYMPYPVLSFATFSAYNGPGLKLMVSMDYDGTSNPNKFTWTEIKGHFPAANSSQWTPSVQIDLGGFKGENVHIAFVYTSSPEMNASRWTLDDFQITKDVAPQPVLLTSPSLLDFDYAKAGTSSHASIITVDAYNLNESINFAAPEGFQLSWDNSTFTSSVVLTQEVAEKGLQNLYVRFVPTTAYTDYGGKIKATVNGINKDVTALSGSSLRALKVANWNIEWFGGNNGPSNDALQQENVKTILQKLNADVYAISEIVGVEHLQQLVAQMPGYAYTVNDYGSYADDANDSDYESAQKLAFIYKSDVVKSISSYGVLRSGGSMEAYRNWASGRFPYLMKAEVVLEGVTTSIDFILVHGKANTGNVAEQQESWARRKGAADELYDSLRVQYPFANIIMLGDFNDDLDETIAPGIAGKTTSYVTFVEDKKNYVPITLPLSLSKQASTTSYEDMIDHQVASNEMGIAYVPGSAHVAKYVESWVSAYDVTTSDHYPVVARYDVRFFARPINFKGFAGAVSSNKVTFDWFTSHEINSNYFVVERSRNGRDFEPVDSVQGLGDSRTGTTYSLTLQPWTGQTHYRLRATSLDGSVYYSPMQTINMKSNSSLLQVSASNPSVVQVAYTTKEERKGVLQLLDLYGRVHFSKVSTFVKGQNLQNIDAHKLASGIYIVRILYADSIESEKVYINK